MKLNRIKEARIKAGLSRRQLGEMIGKNESAIQNIEDKRVNPKFDEVVKICKVLKLKIEEVID